MRYSVFGGVLSTPFRIPELPEATETRTVSWSLSVCDDPPGEVIGRHLGTDKVYGGVQVRAFDHAGGVRLVYDDTGVFDVSAGGRDITWYRAATGHDLDEAGVADLLGRVLAVSLHLDGALTLHASSLVMPDGNGVALLAPKGYGKSTLAAAVISYGGLLLSDDAVPVIPGDGDVCTMSPGVLQVRLWSDSAERVGALPSSIEGRKVVISELPEGRVARTSVTMSAAYVLLPVVAHAGKPVVTRERVGDVEATMALVEHSKVGALLGGVHGAALFTRAADIARRVPVYALRVGRDLTRLDEAATGILAWHR